MARWSLTQEIGHSLRMTSCSRPDTGSYSGPYRSPRWTVRPRLPPLGWPSLACTLPTLRVWQYKTALLYPWRSSPCGLPPGQSRMTTPLRSGPITEPSTLPRAPPPPCPASVLGPLRRLTARVSPFASGRQVPVFLTEACPEVTPPSCRTPVGPSAGIAQPLLAGQKSRSRFRRRLNT